MQRSLILVAIAAALFVLAWRSLSGGSAEAVRGLSAEPAVVPDAFATQDPEVSAASARTGLGQSPGEPEAQREQIQAELAVAPVDSSVGALRIRTLAKEGKAVPGVEFSLTPRNHARLGHGTTHHATEEDGSVLVQDLAPGRFSLLTQGGMRSRGTVVAGEVTEVVVKLDRGVGVTGVVVGPDGSPVPDATVWLATSRRDWQGTQLLTRTDDDGAFFAEHVNADASLGASASGFAPSKLVDLEMVDKSQSPRRIELELTVGGGDLVGRVVGPAGSPVAGAIVAVGNVEKGYSMRRDGTEEEFWSPRVARTDGSGGFAMMGLRGGEQAVHVLAEGFVQFRGTIEVLPAGSGPVQIQLARGVELRGVVRDGLGKPVPEALILLLDAPFVDPFPPQGPTDRGAPFHRPATRSDSQGNYRLANLPAGELHLYAAKGTGYWDDCEYVGSMQATLNGEGASSLKWDPVLTKGHVIRGRVLYADGAPMPLVFVTAKNEDGDDATGNADEEGRFQIPALQNRSYKLWVQLNDSPPDGLPLVKNDVWPGESEVVITASFSKVTEEKATVKVRIDDRAGRVQGAGTVVVAHARGWSYAKDKGGEGVYEARVKPGRYQARMMFGDQIVGGGEWFDVGPGETYDAGIVVTRPAGSLVVRVERPAGIPAARVRVRRVTDYSSHDFERLEAGESEVHFEGLLAGPVTVRISGDGIASTERVVELDAGEPTLATFMLQPAARVTLAVEAEVSENFGTAEVRVLRADGTVYYERKNYERWGATLPFDSKVSMPPGTYRATATTTTGLAASQEFAVTTVEETPRVVLKLE